MQDRGCSTWRPRATSSRQVPCCPTSCLNRAFSSGVHLPLLMLGSMLNCHRWTHCRSVLPGMLCNRRPPGGQRAMSLRPTCDRHLIMQVDPVCRQAAHRHLPPSLRCHLASSSSARVPAGAPLDGPPINGLWQPHDGRRTSIPDNPLKIAPDINGWLAPSCGIAGQN